MKKVLFAAISASMLLASCASDEVIETQAVKGRTPISVDVYTQDLTRAFTPADAASLQTSGFSLRISTATETIFDGDVTYVGGKYQLGDGNTQYYWPLSEDTQVTFSAISKTGLKGSTAFTPTEDILVATTTTLQSAASNGAISLPFSHLMSAATLNIVLNNTSANINLRANVTALTLTRNNSTYNFTTNAWNTAANTPQTVGAIETITTTSATLINDELLVPGTYNLSVTYTVENTDNSDVSAPLTKAGTFTLTAGSRQNIKVSLPVQATAMGVNISTDNVTGWPETGKDSDVTLTQPAH